MPASALSSTRYGQRRSDENAAGLEHVQTGDGEALGTRKNVAGPAFAVAPGVACAGIEQDADHCQVDRGTRPFDRSGIDSVRELAPAIEASGREVTPAAVVRYIEVGIGAARHLRHVIGDRREPVFREGEMWRAAVGDPVPHQAAAFANRGDVVEPAEIGRRFGCGGLHPRLPADRGHSSRPRPSASAWLRRRSPPK